MNVIEKKAGLGALWLPVLDDYTDEDTWGALKQHHPKLVIPGRVGLAECYRRGYQKALELGSDIIIECDVGHPIQDVIQPMVWELGSRHCDVVVSYRRTYDGPWYRKLVSKGGHVLCKLWGLPYPDCTGGLIGFHRSALERLDLKVAKGHGHQVEVKKQLHKHSVPWKQIGIHYQTTESSFSFSSLWDGLRCLVS
jgi:hypothetical protein